MSKIVKIKAVKKWDKFRLVLDCGHTVLCDESVSDPKEVVIGSECECVKCVKPTSYFPGTKEGA